MGDKCLLVAAERRSDIPVAEMAAVRVSLSAGRAGLHHGAGAVDAVAVGTFPHDAASISAMAR